MLFIRGTIKPRDSFHSYSFMASPHPISTKEVPSYRSWIGSSMAEICKPIKIYKAFSHFYSFPDGEHVFPPLTSCPSRESPSASLPDYTQQWSHSIQWGLLFWKYVQEVITDDTTNYYFKGSQILQWLLQLFL